MTACGQSGMIDMQTKDAEVLTPELKASQPQPFLKLDRLEKRFGDVSAVDSVDIEVGRGEFFSLLGPSGCGKTTTMRCIAGFEEPSSGDILVDGKSVLGRHPAERNTGMVFQNYALFPHYNVYRNVAYGLIMEQLRGKQKLRAISNLFSGRRAERDATISARVEEALEQVHLTGYESRKITELSGGQQQRVALARALVKRPSLLLMDEPLSNLDAGLRNEMRTVIRDIQREVGITTLFVTHDQEEAMSMADRVALMKDGKIIQCAEPSELYERPANAWAAKFVGKSNLLQGVPSTASQGNASYININGEKVHTDDPVEVDATEVTVMIRPEDLRIRSRSGQEPGHEKAGDKNAFQGEIIQTTYLGGEVVYLVKTPLGELEAEDTFGGPGTIYEAGTTVVVEASPSRVHLLKATSIGAV